MKAHDSDEAWYYRCAWTRILMFAYCLGCSSVGLLGLFDSPSPAIESQMGRGAVLLYSWILLVSGVIGAVGIFRSLWATVISVWAIAAATLFHGTLLFATGATQSGLRLIVAPLMMVPLAWTWLQWLVIFKHIPRGARPPRGDR